MGLFNKFKKIANDVFDDNLFKDSLFVKEIEHLDGSIKIKFNLRS